MKKKSLSVAEATNWLSPKVDPGLAGKKRVRGKITYALQTKRLLPPLTTESLVSWAILAGYKGLGLAVGGVSSQGHIGTVSVLCVPNDHESLRDAYRQCEVERQRLLAELSHHKEQVRELQAALLARQTKDAKLHNQRVANGRKGGRGRIL